MTHRARVRYLVVGVACVAALNTPVHAQRPAQPDRQTSGGGATHRWEIEGYGGLSLVRIPEIGTPALPAPGSPLTTSSPIFPSRQTSSWFFGDGAALLNDVNAEFGVPSRVSSLDSILESVGRDAGSMGAFGVRVRRGLTRRLAAEVSADVMPRSLNAPDGFAAAIESSRASFQTAFSGLLATGPFVGALVEATGAAASGSGREIAVTGGIEYALAERRSVVPYATLAGGVLTRSGTLPSAALQGRYRFSILGTVPVDETDRVTIRYEQKPTWIAVLGGGVRRAMSDRWGLRLDGRLFIDGYGSRVLLDASPLVARGAPSGFIESFTHPGIQFSNDPSTGRQSTLSGPSIQGFATFTGAEVQVRALVTFGVFGRF